MTLQDIQEQQIQIACADEAEFTQVKNTLLNAGLTSWLFEAGRQVIQVFRDGDIMGDKVLDDGFGVVISAGEFLKRFVYPK